MGSYANLAELPSYLAYFKGTKSSDHEPTKRVPQPTRCVSSPHRKDHAHDVPYLEPTPLTMSVLSLKGGGTRCLRFMHT